MPEPASAHLIELAQQVRGSTLELLAGVPKSWLTWAPPGTSNHILWHAGHALWLQDALCIERLTGHSELPGGWSETFGMGSRPNATSAWPSRREVHGQLASQLDRMVELFRSDSSGRLAHIEHDPPRGRGLVGSIIHGLHDEARHQGEMYLLSKLCRAAGLT